VTENLCSPAGLILLELFGDESECAAAEAKLRDIKGLQVQKMLFDF